jgi:hypothetical protein
MSGRPAALTAERPALTQQGRLTAAWRPRYGGIRDAKSYRVVGVS